MSSRKDMLQRIRSSLDKNRGILQEIAALARTPYPTGPFIHATQPPVEQFIAELHALQAHPHRCPNVAASRKVLTDLLLSHKADRVMHWNVDDPSIPDISAVLDRCGVRSVDARVLGSPDRIQHLHGLDNVPLCISGVDAAVAESGTIIVVSGPGRGRLASLLPPIHVALVPAGRIVGSLPEAWSLLETQFGHYVAQTHANISLITGPSRTADIEQTLTLGVHGPKELHVIVIDGT